jgi:hypothetical protein
MIETVWAALHGFPEAKADLEAALCLVDAIQRESEAGQPGGGDEP